MSDLTDICTRIRTQYLDPNKYAVEDDTLEEAVRSALGDISRVYESPHTLEGLDGALETTLPERDIPVLMTGASGYVLTILLQYCFSHYTPSLVDDANLMKAEHHMNARFKTLLTELRMDDFQRSQACPHIDWEWHDLAPWETAD